jgi:hypothetical protein
VLVFNEAGIPIYSDSDWEGLVILCIDELKVSKLLFYKHLFPLLFRRIMLRENDVVKCKKCFYKLFYFSCDGVGYLYLKHEFWLFAIICYSLEKFEALTSLNVGVRCSHHGVNVLWF